MKYRLRNRLGEVVAALTILGGSVMVAAPSLAANTNVNLTAANTFDQANVTINEGDTVTFTWQGGFHDVVFADGVSSGTPVGIDGTTYSRTFDTAGSYSYVCTVHESSGMVGTVTVEAAASTATTAPAGNTTATTAAPSSNSGSNTQTGGAASGAGSATTQPFTGPEDSVLPMAGLILIAGGLGLGLRLRRSG